jgi:hypothetical protein
VGYLYYFILFYVFLFQKKKKKKKIKFKARRVEFALAGFLVWLSGRVLGNVDLGLDERARLST